jgi:RES domain
LIEEFPRARSTARVLKLASLPRERIDAILLKRGLSPESIPDVKTALGVVNVPLTAEEAVSYSFREPYRVGRFGDGTFGVFYSARAEPTCIAEISYHHGRQLAEQRSGTFAHDRFCDLISCDFTGDALSLVGAEAKYRDLDSPTDAGYPFCQRLAKAAIVQGVDAFYTRSARDQHGTGVPIFNRRSITNAQSLARFRFFAEAGQSRHERLP